MTIVTIVTCENVHKHRKVTRLFLLAVWYVRQRGKRVTFGAGRFYLAAGTSVPVVQLNPKEIGTN